MDSPIPFIKPEFPSIKAVGSDLKEIYKNNYYTNNGPVYHRFVEAMGKYLGEGINVAALNNATIALMLAMKACFKKETKYVAVPAFTFPAGPLAIEWCNYEPIFFDVDIKTAQPSLDSFESVYEKYGDQLAGILLVNNYGIGNQEIAEWESLSKARGLALVIDSAPGIGSQYPDGELLGGRGDCEVFSMHATKPFGVGEGGLVTTKNRQLAEQVERLKNFGLNDAKVTVIGGLNGKITELDCAIGLRILSNFDEILRRRRAVHALYEKHLTPMGIRFLPHARQAAIQFATAVAPEAARGTILKALADNNISTRTYYAPPLHLHPHFKDALKVNLSDTELLSKQVISLPVHNDMDAKTVEFICSVIKGAARG